MLAKSLLRAKLINVRGFSAASQAYESVGEGNLYTPVHKPQFSGKSLTVFNSEDCKEKRSVPFEVKEASIKNGLGIIGVYMASNLFQIGPFFALGQAFFCFNYTFSVWKLMSHAVTKVDLHDDGKKVTLTFGRVGGKTKVVDIKDIRKLENEKALVETFDEGLMFPVTVGDQKYYLNGPGHEAVKNGEIFRAIINGQPIKL